MPVGISVIVSDGVAHITPDPNRRGEVARALTAVTNLISVDTSGSRKAYIVTEETARAAGLLDELPAPEPAKAPAKAPAKKAAPKKAAADTPPATEE